MWPIDIIARTIAFEAALGDDSRHGRGSNPHYGRRREFVGVGLTPEEAGVPRRGDEEEKEAVEDTDDG